MQPSASMRVIEVVARQDGHRTLSGKIASEQRLADPPRMLQGFAVADADPRAIRAARHKQRPVGMPGCALDQLVGHPRRIGPKRLAGPEQDRSVGTAFQVIGGPAETDGAGRRIERHVGLAQGGHGASFAAPWRPVHPNCRAARAGLAHLELRP